MSEGEEKDEKIETGEEALANDATTSSTAAKGTHHTKREIQYSPATLLMHKPVTHSSSPMILWVWLRHME